MPHSPQEFVELCGLCNTPLVFMAGKRSVVFACPTCKWVADESQCATMNSENPDEQDQGQDRTVN